jgi:hypothetical protein
MPATQECRVTSDTDQSLGGIIFVLTGGNLGATSVLLQWLDVDPYALLGFLNVLDTKHLYDEHIWNVYKLCGEDINRFIYHVQMELPDQATGRVSVTGPYTAEVNREGFFAKRRFGKPGSYWALEHPPVETNYSYPIR